MRDITRRALRVLNADSYSPVELIEIRVPGATEASVIRLTNAGEVVVFGGNTYYAINFSRSEIRDVVSADAGDQATISMTFANIDRQMAELLNQVEIEGSQIIIYLHDRTLLAEDPSRTRDAITLFKGEVRNPILTSAALVFQAVSILGIMDAIVIPNRIFQPKCNVRFGSVACGVDNTVSPFTIQTTASFGSNRNYVLVPAAVITAAGSPSDPDEYWINGYVVVADGPLACQSRPISHVKVAGGERRFYVDPPFLANPQAGDVLLIVRGCPKTKPACADRQADGTAKNFQGFEEIPANTQPKANYVQGYD